MHRAISGRRGGCLVAAAIAAAIAVAIAVAAGGSSPLAPRKPNQPRRRGGGRPGRTSIRTNLSVTVISLSTDARLGLVRDKFVCLSPLIEGDAGPLSAEKAEGNARAARLKAQAAWARDAAERGVISLRARNPPRTRRTSKEWRNESGSPAEERRLLDGENCEKEFCERPGISSASLSLSFSR